MTTELHNETLDWAAEWIEGSLKGEFNERVKEFGRNMAMTFRAAKTVARVSANGVPTVDATSAARSCEIFAQMIESENDLSGQTENWRDFYRGQHYAAKQLADAFRCAASAASTVAPQQSAAGPKSNLEPHAYQEHPLYPNYCAFAVGDEDYCKRESDNAIHTTVPAPSAAVQDETELTKLRQAIGWICDAADAAYIEDSDNARIHEIFNIAAQAAGITRRLPDEYQRFDESGSE